MMDINAGDEPNQSTIYVYIEMSQQNTYFNLCTIITY
jgi:hypothetical protein